MSSATPINRIMTTLMSIPGMSSLAASELATPACGRSAAEVAAALECSPQDLADVLGCWKKGEEIAAKKADLAAKKAELDKEELAVATHLAWLMNHAR